MSYNNYQNQGEAASYLGQSNQGYHQENQYHYAPEESSHEYNALLSNIMGNTSSHQPAQDHEIRAAQQHYEQVINNPGQNNSAEAVGNAAAVQALQRSQQTGGGMGDMIKMAMSIASNLSGGGQSTGGGGSGAGKSQAIQQAAMMAVKLYMSKQSSGGGQHQAGAGGALGGLLGMLMGSSGGGGQQQQAQHSSSGMGGIGAMVGSLLGGGGHSQQSGQQQQQQQQSHGYSQPSNNNYPPQQSHAQNNNNYYPPPQQGNNASYAQQAYGQPQQSYGNQVPPQAQQHQSQGGTDYAALASGLMNKIFK
ncbi:hypothetical protein RMATCC62417_04598 [Rhizopus microsporus]|nr:hypothetical protein RMATCC62417_04598 [Rhizopus microsporus]